MPPPRVIFSQAHVSDSPVVLSFLLLFVCLIDFSCSFFVVFFGHVTIYTVELTSSVLGIDRRHSGRCS